MFINIRSAAPSPRPTTSGLRCSVSDISQNAVNLGSDVVRLPHPVFDGDTLYAQSEVLEKRESRSRPQMGIVSFKTTGCNKDGKIVIEFKRTILVYRRGFAPLAHRPDISAQA